MERLDVFYNEFDPYASAWLKNLMASGHITEGVNDARSIIDVKPYECKLTSHFFAGIGGWDLALRLAGWPTAIPVWTGSCPCQPFSSAGKHGGTADPRHLWPDWFRLIRACRPQYIFGEQVESAVHHGWLDGVFGDLEGEGYACGAAVLGAHSVGAPHIRQRLYWVAYAERNAYESRRLANEPRESLGTQSAGASIQLGRLRDVGGVVNSSGERPGRTPGEVCRQDGRPAQHNGGIVVGTGETSGRLGIASGERFQERGSDRRFQPEAVGSSSWEAALGASPWSDAVWIPCRDGKARRIKSGLEPLAHGVPGRVGRLRAYGNAIVPAVAAEFVRAVMDTLEIAP
jgi:DNA (cytosine-5)-methyltransferase 1